MKQIRVLIVENLVSDEELLLLKLTRAGYEVESERVESAAQMKKALAEKEWDVIISDYEMPSFNGMESHRILQKSGLDIPFIIVSGSIGEETAVQAMLAGVNDYLMKDNIARLVPAIERELKSAEDRKNQRQTEQKLQESAERHQILFEEANDAIYTIDFDGNFTSVNKKGEVLFELSRREILRSNFDEFLRDEDIPAIREQRRQKLKGIINEKQYELRLTTKTGSRKIVEINSRLIHKNEKPFEIEGVARDITNRKKLQDDFNESAKRLKLALDAAKMGVWEWNIETNEIFWSDECYLIFGHEASDISTQSFKKIVHPADFEELNKTFREAVEGAGMFKSEYRLVNREDGIRWISNAGIIEYDIDGKPLRGIGTVKDITVEKRLEQNLIATESRFRTLAENNVAGVTLCEADGKLIFVNDAYLEIVGYSREDFKSGKLRWNEITAPEFHEADNKGIERARRKGKSEQYEKEYIRKDGSRVSVLVGIAHSKIDGEENFISTILDFTERKILEKNLAVSERRFRALGENNVAGVTLGKADGNLTFANDAFLVLTGYTRQDFENGLVNCHQLTPTEYYPFDELAIEQARQNGKSEPYEKEYIRKDGSRVPAFLAIALNDIDGEEFFICTILDFTEQKKAEKELNESGEDFRALVEATSQGVWTIAEGEENDIFNEFWQNLTGQTYEQSMDLGWLDAVHPEDREFTERAWSLSLTNTIPLNVVYRVLTVSGNYNYYAVRGVPVLDEKGEFRKWIGTFSDITERKEFEDALRQSEARLQLSQEAGRVGSWEWNLATNKLIWSDMNWTLYGVEQGTMPEDLDDWKKLIYPDDAAHVESKITAAIAGGETIEVEFRITKNDNRIGWLASKGRVIRDKNGEVEKLIGINTDITERKEVEEKLRQSEARLKLSQQSAKIGTWEWNLATNKTIWSDGVWNQLGLEIESIDTNYNKYMDFVLPEDVKGLEYALVNSVKCGGALDTEYRIRRTDDKISWICAKGSVVYEKNGKPERMVGVTIDVTDRKTAEENLHKTEENLRQAQKLESIGRLAGGIAHDFNNMLTAINGYSDLTLRSLGMEHPLRSNIQEIKNAGERSALLTSQLLAFSRQQILQPKILKINETISEITTLLKRLIGEDVRLVTDLHPAAGQIKADPGQITQVIMNLAVNSRDAIKKGGTITIETRKVKRDGNYVQGIGGSSAGNYVLLAVTDDGSGMDSKTMEHIFEPFYTTKEKGIGTGLGLATVYGIIEQSGGHIEVRSEIGKGSTFEIYLPQVDDETEAIHQRTSADSHSKGKETIFIVEDEEIVRKLTSQILDSYGYRVIEAKNGTEALEMCQKGENNFDLLLTDVVMPQMGGFELSQHLLNMLPPFPILFTSGYTEDLHLRHELVDEDSNFIHKPFTPESLALKIRKILDER